MPRYVKEEVLQAKKEKQKRTIKNRLKKVRKMKTIRAEENIKNRRRMKKKKKNCPFCPKNAA